MIASLYAEAAPLERLRLLRNLLRPVGPLALAAVAAGAFSRLLPPLRWSGARVTIDDVHEIEPSHVVDLVRYVEQKAPELLWSLPELLPDSPLWLGAVGTLLLLALRAANRAGR